MIGIHIHIMERGIQGVRLINNVYNLITLNECAIVPVLKIARLKGGK